MLNPDKLKWQHLEQRKVCCSQARGTGGLYSRTQTPQWCSGKHFKGKIWSMACRMDAFHSDQLMMKWQGSVPGFLCSYARPQRYIAVSVPWGGTTTLLYCCTVVPSQLFFVPACSHFLITNCLNLPFGNQGRPTNRKWGLGKIFVLMRAPLGFRNNENIWHYRLGLWGVI